MINNDNYQTKEFAPTPSVHAVSLKSKLRTLRKQSRANSVKKANVPTGIVIHPKDLDSLSDFVKL